MEHQHPFRFAVGCPPFASRRELVEHVRTIEQIGYSTLVTGDHICLGHAAPMPFLMAVADATTTLRVATNVLANDFRHPVLLAQEAATVDLLSEGRLELGIGAGWAALDYTTAGVPFAPARTRVERLEETVALIKQLFRGQPVTFAGRHYSTQQMALQIRPAQQPHPPLFIGGGSKQVLSLAGREADIVGLDPKSTAAGAKDLATMSAEAVQQKLAWVRAAAGERFPVLELHMLYNHVMVTHDRRSAARQIAAELASLPPGVLVNVDTSIEGILTSHGNLIGSVAEIVEQLQERRERFGVSYITAGGDDVAAFAPVIERLAGT